MYCKGFGVEKDYQKAFEYYKKAVSLGNTMAMNNIYKNFTNISFYFIYYFMFLGYV